MRGGRLALITMGPTPYDDVAEIKLSGDVEAELEAVLAALSVGSDPLTTRAIVKGSDPVQVAWKVRARSAASSRASAALTVSTPAGSRRPSRAAAAAARTAGA